MIYNIAIDGPAGAGKSTIARRVAAALGFIYVDTGAMYRAMALHLVRAEACEEEARLNQECGQADICLSYENGEQIVLLNGANVNAFIRTEEIGLMTSRIAKNPVVRTKMAALQKELAARTSVVMDGRDIGTCVLPDAFLKIYLTAGSRTRAKRRYQELTANGITCDLDEIERDIIARDRQDMTRTVAPLTKADDAILVDSSDMDIEQVTRTLLDLFEERKAQYEGKK